MENESSESLKKPVEWLFNPSLRWLYHVLFWMFIYSDEVLSFLGVTETMDDFWTVPLSLVVDMIVVYTVMYILLPLFLNTGKGFVFISVSLFFILLDCFIQMLLWDSLAFFDGEPAAYLLTFFLSVFVSTGLIVGFSSGIKIFKNYILKEIKIKQLETDNLNAELVYLKNQINPHFLFNSLNNIYVLSRKDSKMTSESILLLSDLLRYQLYECNHESVNLQGEIDNLKNFLELEQLRKDNTELIFEVEGNTLGMSIAPYIFLPFVENAIKHGSSANNEKGYLKINFNVKNNNRLIFIVENSKPELPLITETGGIGLTNVKRRLELVYPDKYELDIENDKKYYKVSLSIYN